MGSVLGTGRQHATSVCARFVGVQRFAPWWAHSSDFLSFPGWSLPSSSSPWCWWRAAWSLRLTQLVSWWPSLTRQTAEAEQEENQAGPFDLFGQVLNSFGGLLGQLATVGGEFISEQQRLNQPVHEELGKIGGTISRSGFVQGATNGVAEVPNLNAGANLLNFGATFWIGTILSRMQVNRTEQPDAWDRERTKTSLVSSTVAMKINLLQTLACIFVPQQCPTTTTTKSSTPWIFSE